MLSPSAITVEATPEPLSFHRLQPTRQTRWLGLLGTALIFDLLHLNFSTSSLLAKLGFGLVFGLLRERSGSLVAPFVAHALFWVLAGTL